MDRETKYELQHLLTGLTQAIDQVRFAASEDEEIAGWRKVQTLSWRLNQVMPALRESRLAG
jgi:hypothetical protein